MKKIFLGLLLYSFASAQSPKIKIKPTEAANFDYKYEVNTAPLALFANWYSLDVLKYNPSDIKDPSRSQFGYGFAMVAFNRNSNDIDDTFPSRIGYAYGATVIEDDKDYYFAAHAFYEKFERYRDTGILVQQREGPRVNFVVGGKDVFKKRFALRFGWGIEVQAYKVVEFNETNRALQKSYNTLLLNPFFLEMKLSAYF